MSLSTNTGPDKGQGPGKFLFDVSFDGGDDPYAALRNPAEAKVNMKVSEFEAAKAQAYADGVNAGKAEAASSQQAQLNALMEMLGTRLQSLATDAAASNAARDETMALAIKAVAYKLLPAYAAQNGLTEIENIVTKTLADLRDEPRLVVRVAEMHVDTCAQRLPELAKTRAFPGQLIILADATLGPSDCRLEWADGGLERLENNLWTEIERALAKYARPGSNMRAAQVEEYAHTQNPTDHSTAAEGGIDVNQ